MLHFLTENPLQALQHVEIYLNIHAQNNLQFAEPVWLFLSEHFSAAQLMDIFVPLVGAFHHQLLVRLVCSLGILNALSSLVKWTLPAYRPLWWVRELEPSYNQTTLKQYHATCETTAGFPSQTVMSLTAFSYLVVIFAFAYGCRRWQMNEKHLNRTCYIIVSGVATIACLSRMYLGTQFLHQCILAAMAAIVLLHIFDLYSSELYTLGKRKSILIVCCLGLLPVAVYFGMQRSHMDPHWSVRMAFKWCADPSLLRHEASPIFVLGRDFGHLMGMALSAPMFKRYESTTTSLTRRIPLVFSIELLNYLVRQETPKQSGRFAFVAYEFGRNVFHSYGLLTIVSKLT